MGKKTSGKQESKYTGSRESKSRGDLKGNVYIYWLRPNFSNYWNVEIVKYVKKKDDFRRGSSLEISYSKHER